MWDHARVASALAAGLRAEADRLDEEQAVRGLDALDELALHPLLASGLRAGGFGAHPERHYPAGGSKRRKSEGERCDLVVVEPADAPPPETRDDAPLFAPGATPAHDALWLEVKVAAQHALAAIGAAPNPRYAGVLTREAVRDAARLAGDPGIRHGAVAVVLFAETAEHAAHDLNVWVSRCLRRGLPVRTPFVEGFGLIDRIGNAWCALALAPVGRA